MYRYIFPLIVLLFISSCGNNNLTRDNAQKIITENNNIVFLKKNIPIYNSFYRNIEKGASQGIWVYSNNKIIFSEKSKIEIENINQNYIIIKKPENITINVTGITNVPATDNLKEVQFNWMYQRLPKLVKRFAIDNGTGNAIFRLYDDGWRIEHIDIKNSDKPAFMTEKEKQEEANDITEELRQKRIQEEKKRKIIADLNKKIEDTKMPKKTIKILSIKNPAASSGVLKILSTKTVTTDNHCKVSDTYLPAL